MKRTVALAMTLAFLLSSGLVSAQSVEEVLSQFDHEPTILEVQEAVNRYNLINQGTMSGWTPRANAAPVLPRVRVEYRTTSDDDLQNTEDQSFTVPPGGDPILTDIDRESRTENDDELRLRIQGDWELNELIFNPELLRISNQASDMVELRQDLLTTVTAIYYERRRAQVQLVLDPPSDPAERLRRELELQELTASIDALTGGWFSQQLSAAGASTY
jgi:hypothetical protein